MLVNKEEIHQLINNCDNEIVLAEFKELLQSPEIRDWWDELSSQDKNLLLESEIQNENGSFISHDKLTRQFAEPMQFPQCSVLLTTSLR